MTSQKAASPPPQKATAKDKSFSLGFTLSVSLLIAAAVFCGICGILFKQDLLLMDKAVSECIRGFATPGLTKIVIVITHLGSAYVEIGLLLLLSALLLFRSKYVPEMILLAVTLSGAWLLNIGLKAFFQRARPDLVHFVQVEGYSFPSGHAMVAAAFYGVLGYLLWLNLRKRGKPAWYVAVLTIFLITGIGLSRIYLGVHFASDVVAGFIAGGVWAAVCIVIHKNTRHSQTPGS